MKPIVIVSHSLPFWVVSDEKTGELHRQPCATGLATVLAPFVAKTADTCWIGWCGREFTGSGMKIPESTEPTSISHGIKSSQIVLAPFIHQHQHHKVHARFLNGMCHSSLWPLLHSMPIYAQFSLDHWQAYVEVNSEFAKTTMTTTLRLMNEYKAQNAERKNRALIWIHDYHLMLMPSMLRSRLDKEETATIAFFLHTPFPAWDVFRLCPWSKELLLGLVLGCSLVAFHTNMYANNFMECCWHVLGAKIDRVDMSIEYGNKTTMIRALPVGIPFNWFENKSREAAPVEALKGQEKVILGVDRFDYTKGILQRVLGYERFLEKYPETRTKVVLYQIVAPSHSQLNNYQQHQNFEIDSQYLNLKTELERQIARICGRFSTTNWQPIKYIYKRVSQYELCGYYRAASIALVTPIRDGMNLVAKEFIACQDLNVDPGVLVLSVFAGASESMFDGAILVNPMERDLLADALKNAYDMKFHERRLRMQSLQSRERQFDVDAWFDSFTEACDLVESSMTLLPHHIHSLNLGDYESWLEPLCNGYARLTIILDYDGTLVPLEAHPDMAVLTDDLRVLLKKFIECSYIDLGILSGRSLANLRQMLPLKGLTIAGSHGLELQLAGSVLTEECCGEQSLIYKGKVGALALELRDQVCTQGGWVEEKIFHVVFHWRDTSINYRPTMIQKAKDIMQKHGFQAIMTHYGVEARPPIGWDKGRGVLNMLEKLHGLRWAEKVKVVYIGDDETDEGAMRALCGLGITFRVGKPNAKTSASHRLPNPAAVKAFLEWAISFVERKKNAVNSIQRQNQDIVKSGIKNII